MSPRDLASVSPIGERADWSAKAAAGDAMQQVGHDRPIVCLWIDEQGVMRYAKANTSVADLCTMQVFLAHMATYAWRKVEEDD